MTGTGFAGWRAGLGVVGETARPEGSHQDRPAERGLETLGRRTAVSARIVGVTVCGALALPGAPSMGPTLVAVAAAAAGFGVYRRYVAERRPLWLAVDLVIVCGVCVSLRWTVAPQMLDGGTGWVRNFASITVMAYQWHTRPRIGAVVAVAVAGAYLFGGLMSSGASVPTLWRGSRMLLEAALARGLWMLVRNGARRADQAREREEAGRMRGAVAAAAQAEERDYLAALHDTASATLLMVGLGVPGRRRQWLSEQASRDVKILTDQTGQGAGRVDLAEQLSRVDRVGQVEVDLITDGPVWMPPGPASAVRGAVEEALANVAAHAGVRTATVRIDRRGEEVVVQVIDRGRGFVPAMVSRHKRGLSLSITERMAASGGAASVASWPGGGTCVRLMWAPGGRVGIMAQAERGDLARSDELARRAFMRGIHLSVLAIIVCALLTIELPMLIGHAHVYGLPKVQFAAYGIQLLVATTIASRLLRRPTMGRAGAPLFVAVVAASAASVWGIPSAAAGTPVHWAYGNIGWFGLVLLTEAPPWVLLTVPCVDYLLALTRCATQGDAGAIAVLTTATVFIVFCQEAVAISTWTLRRLAEVVAQAARKEEELRVKEAVARRIREDRQDRYMDLNSRVVPLLKGLASGELDPADPRVRRDCAIEAARLRRLFAERDEVSDPLVHELQACIDVAERRGIAVALAIRGRRPVLGRAVRAALTEPALVALMTAATTARVTVVGSPAAVSVSVVADLRTGTTLPTVPNRHDQVTVSQMATGTSLWIEGRWRTTNRSR